MVAKPLVLAAALVAVSAFAKGGKEEQRKYDVAETPALTKLLVAGTPEDFRLKRHVTYEMVDFYVDTPSFQMKEQGLSLRMRRAIKDAGKVEYEFQFKSEMETPSAIRMEMEEKELLPMQIAGGRPLTEAMEDAAVGCRDAAKKGGVAALRANAKAMKAIADMTEWLGKGTRSTLEPFQEMRARKIDIARLRPVTCGHANRARTRIERRRADRTFHWVMEASLDHATFLPLVPAKRDSTTISELEVENKDADKDEGRKALDDFEKILMGKYGAKRGQASKYLQACRGLQLGNP
jgi:hypothetical protein